MNIKDSVKEAIGNTPLIRANKINAADADILMKFEAANPSGSVKDRAALYMLEDAKKRRLIKENSTIIEPTSGNTGIGLAMIAAVDNYKLILVMPDTMSPERVKMFKAYGADVVLTDGKLGMSGAIAKAEELNKKIAGSFIPQQFSNSANRLAHKETTARELWADTDGKIDVFVAGVGTGGTLCGTAEELKKLNPQIRIVAVEPQDSPILSGGKAAPHKLQGIGANFVPALYSKELVDEVFCVSTQQAGDTARALAKKEGLFVGISSGAAMYAALEIAKRPQYKNKNIVVILPDSGSRYLSTWLFEE